MNSLCNRINRQRGIGLVEVMITLVVVSVGLLAIFVLQSDMIASGSEAKARNEAMEIGRQKIEELRNYVALPQYNLQLPVATRTDTKQGVNASFTRSWTVSDNPAGDGTANLKELAVTVTWTDAKGVVQRVNLTTYLAYSAPIKTVELEKADDAKGTFAPSPNISGIEGMEKGTEGDTRDPNNDTNVGDGTDADLSDDIYKRVNSQGNVELYTWDGTTAEVVLTVYGGVIQTSRGKLYREDLAVVADPGTLTDPVADCKGDPLPKPCDDYGKAQSYFLGLTTGTVVDNIDLEATSPSYCMFPFNVDLSKKPVSAEYICYYGGDCSNGPADQYGCPADVSGIAAINGGWYGKIGILQYDSNNPYAVCTGSIQDLGSNTKDTPAREYVTLKIAANSARNGLCTKSTGVYFVYPPNERRALCVGNNFYDVVGNQGINRSFKCHSFLLADSTISPSSLSAGCQSREAAYGLYLAPRNIFRTLDAADNTQINVVMGEDDSYCAFVEIAGKLDITDPLKAIPTVTMDGGTCVVDTGTNPDTYKCRATTALWEGTLTVTAVLDDKGVITKLNCTNNTIVGAGASPPYTNGTYTKNFATPGKFDDPSLFVGPVTCTVP